MTNSKRDKNNYTVYTSPNNYRVFSVSVPVPVLQAHMSPVVSQGPHGGLTQGAGFVHLDILPMLGQHVLLVFLFVGELEGTERAEKAVVFLHVPEVVCQTSDCVLAVRAGAVHLGRGRCTV